MKVAKINNISFRGSKIQVTKDMLVQYPSLAKAIQTKLGEAPGLSSTPVNPEPNINPQQILSIVEIALQEIRKAHKQLSDIKRTLIGSKPKNILPVTPKTESIQSVLAYNSKTFKLFNQVLELDKPKKEDIKLIFDNITKIRKDYRAQVVQKVIKAANRIEDEDLVLNILNSSAKIYPDEDKVKIALEIINFAKEKQSDKITLALIKEIYTTQDSNSFLYKTNNENLSKIFNVMIEIASKNKNLKLVHNVLKLSEQRNRNCKSPFEILAKNNEKLIANYYELLGNKESKQFLESLYSDDFGIIEKHLENTSDKFRREYSEKILRVLLQETNQKLNYGYRFLRNMFEMTPQKNKRSLQILIDERNKAHF